MRYYIREGGNTLYMESVYDRNDTCRWWVNVVGDDYIMRCMMDAKIPKLIKLLNDRNYNVVYVKQEVYDANKGYKLTHTLINCSNDSGEDDTYTSTKEQDIIDTLLNKLANVRLDANPPTLKDEQERGTLWKH